jgi:hypothetical protein
LAVMRGGRERIYDLDSASSWVAVTRRHESRRAESALAG